MSTVVTVFATLAVIAFIRALAASMARANAEQLAWTQTVADADQAKFDAVQIASERADYRRGIELAREKLKAEGVASSAKSVHSSYG